LLQQVPLRGGAALVVRQRVAEDPGRERHVRLGLADAGVGTHGGPDEKAVGRVRDEGLIGGRIVGRADEADPHIELGRADQLGVVEIDVADDEDLPGTRRARMLAAVLGARRRARRVGVPDHVGLVGAEEHERAGDQIVSPWLIVTVLLATERPLCMRSTVMSRGASGDAPGRTRCGSS
jgi:hypothetical protein